MRRLIKLVLVVVLGIVGVFVLGRMFLGGRAAPEPPLREMVEYKQEESAAAPAASMGGELEQKADSDSSPSFSRAERKAALAKAASSGLLDVLRGPSRGGAGSPGADGDDSPSEETTASPYERERLVHYNGFIKSRVTKPSEALDRAVAIATGIGGYVETLSSSSVTFRVPVARFHETFAQLLTLGDVLEKSTTAEDVTDAFVSVELRLNTAKATRERLLELLARARNEEEKLRLLAEIQRLTLEIDRMDAQRRTLASLASFSRLTLEVVQREAMAARSVDDELAEFRWIHALSPFRRDVLFEGTVLRLEVPKGMVALDERERFIAESADGAVFWASTRLNEPAGDSTFWIEAIKARLAPEFASADIQEVGGFKVLRLVDRSEAAYRYLVGVRVEGVKLQLIEVYYPSEAHETRYGEAVLASIRQGG